MSQNSGAKFTLFPKSSVALYSETVGCPNLNESVQQSLSEDVTYRLKEIIQNAMRVMKHSKRRCMTTNDFSTALKWSDSQLIYGHNGIDISHFKSFNFKDKNISYIEDKDIHLRELAFDQNLPADPGEVSIKGKPNKDESSTREVLEEPYASFIQQIISSVFGSNSNARKLAVNTIRTSGKLQTVLPYFVTFLACQVLQIVKLLRFILSDGHLPVAYWECKIRAARILTQLCRRHISTMSYLPHHLLKAYQECLHDESKSLGSFYGAAFGIACLGAEPTHQVLWPILISKCEKLKETVDNAEDPNVIQECLMLYGLLQDLSVFLIRTAASTSGHSSAKSTNRSSLLSSHKYFAIYADLLKVFHDGVVSLTQFSNLTVSPGRPNFCASKQQLSKQEQNSKNLLNLEIASVRKDYSPFSAAKSVLAGSQVSRLVALQPRKQAVEDVNAHLVSSISTSFGVINNRLMWKANPLKTKLGCFTETDDGYDDDDDDGPSEAKKRKVDGQPRFQVKPAEQRDFLAGKVTIQSPVNLLNLAKIPVTLDIIW
eukprot:gene19970-21925_t